MAPGYGISGIGLDPFALGGMYASYDACMPSMFGSYGMGMMPGMYGGMGMMPGMYGMDMNSIYEYPLRYTEMMQKMQEMQLQHNGKMYGMEKQNEVSANRFDDSAWVEKILTNGSVVSLTKCLADKVRRGELDGVQNEYDKLRNEIYNTYKDEISARAKYSNPAVVTREVIEKLYARVVTSDDGQPANLRNDIQRYGESPLVNGFQQGFNLGHDKSYIAQAINHIYGEDISNIESNENSQQIGKIGGRVAHGGQTGLIVGGGAGLATGAAAAITAGLTYAVTAPFKGKPSYGLAKGIGSCAIPVAIIGTIAGAIADWVKPGWLGKLCPIS